MPSRNMASVGGASALKLTTSCQTVATGASIETEASTSYSTVGPRARSRPARSGGGRAVRGGRLRLDRGARRHGLARSGELQRARSEERRAGERGRSRWLPDEYK